MTGQYIKDTKSKVWENGFESATCPEVGTSFFSSLCFEFLTYKLTKGCIPKLELGVYGMCVIQSATVAKYFKFHVCTHSKHTLILTVTYMEALNNIKICTA